MRQIVYASRATGLMNRDAFAALVDQSIMNNARTGITGLLLFDGYRFLQAIEGPFAQVEACMARVKDDPRHYAIDIAFEGETDIRQFGTFSMASMMPGLDGKRDFLIRIKSAVSLVRQPDIQALFIGFAVLA
jgi:hypothetical protein